MPTLSLEFIDETDGALRLGRPTSLAFAAQPSVAQELSVQEFSRAVEADAALEFIYEGEPWRRLRIHKLAHLRVVHELDIFESSFLTHVMSKVLTPAVEADSAPAQTFVTGDKTFKTIIPVFESG